MTVGTDIVFKSVRGVLIVMGVTALQFGVKFGTQLILARILVPECFGVMAFAWTVVGFVNTFSSLRGDRFIVKAKENIQTVINNTFTVDLLLSAFLIVTLVFLSPSAMRLAGKPELTPVVRLLALTLLYNPFAQPKALFERTLDFKYANIPVVVGIVAEATVSIPLALAGYGVWALALGRLSKFALESAVIWFIAPYRPSLTLDSGVVRDIVDYGWPLMGAAALVFFYWNVDYYMVGILLGDEQLGYYWLAFQMTQYLLVAREALSKVVFPAFCRLESDDALVTGFTMLTKYTAVVFLLPCVLMLLLGRQGVRLIFGEKWLPATVPLQIFMFLTALRAITGYWDPVFLSKGETRIMFVATAINSLVLPSLGYFLTRWYGIVGMSAAVLLTIFIATVILADKLRRLLRVGYAQILWRPSLAAGLTLLVALPVRLVLRDGRSLLWFIGLALLITIVYGVLTGMLVKEIRQDLHLVLSRVRGI